MTDLNWLGNKARSGASSLGGWLKSKASKLGSEASKLGSAAWNKVDNAYDNTKAGIKKTASAVVNAPSNLRAKVDKFKKDHNFSQAHSGVKQANAAL